MRYKEPIVRMTSSGRRVKAADSLVRIADSPEIAAMLATQTYDWVGKKRGEVNINEAETWLGCVDVWGSVCLYQ